MSKTGDNDLARKIRNLRSKLSMTQEQFAAKVGVTFSTVNRWESGKSKPSPLAMRQIEDLLEELNHSEFASPELGGRRDEV
jgi:DNA-binding transcriptional regulator YiaG